MPEVILLLLFGAFILTSGLIGYSSGISEVVEPAVFVSRNVSQRERGSLRR